MSSTPFKPSSDGFTRTLAVVCTGTASEVLQYLAFGEALQRLGGFRVKAVTHAVHREVAASYGLAFAPLQGDVTSVYRTSAFRDAVATGNYFVMAQLFKKEADATMEANLSLILAACRDMDGIVCSIGVLTECLAIGQKYQRPVVLAPLLPFSPSGELPLAQLFPQPAKYSFLNKASYDLSGTLLWAVMGPKYNKFRTQTLGIGPQGGYELEGVPQVTAFSSVTVPRPSDWGPHIRTSGYWAPPASTTSAAIAAAASVTPRLASLVHAAKGWEVAKRPLVVAFEATPPPDYIEVLKAVQASAARAGITAIVISMDGRLGALRDHMRVGFELSDVVWEVGSLASSSSASSPSAAAAAAAAASPPGAPSGATGTAHGGFPRLLIVPDVPYSWVFPIASAVIHAGGGGATQAAWAAGVPAAAFPAVGADFFWAARSSALGVAPPAVYEMKDCVARLDDAVRLCRTPQVWGAAGELAKRLQGGAAAAAAAAGGGGGGWGGAALWPWLACGRPSPAPSTGTAASLAPGRPMAAQTPAPCALRPFPSSTAAGTAAAAGAWRAQAASPSGATCPATPRTAPKSPARGAWTTGGRTLQPTCTSPHCRPCQRGWCCRRWGGALRALAAAGVVGGGAPQPGVAEWGGGGQRGVAAAAAPLPPPPAVSLLALRPPPLS